MKRKLLITTAIVAVVMGLLMSSRAHASVNDFIINDFTADYYLSRDDPQGQLHIIENIKLTFHDYNHGILRAIPSSYKGHSVKLKINNISSESGASAHFTTYSQAGNTVLKIGDPNHTITGNQSYTIDYSLQNVVSYYADHDELYWDTNGDQWQQPFEHVTANFHLPKDLNITDKRCYTGSFGSLEQDCTINTSGDAISFQANKQLEANENLSAVLAFPKGYFKPPTARDWWHDNYGKVLAITLPPLLIGSWAFRRWQTKGKDVHGRDTIIPEYEPPAGISPAEMGVVNSYRLNPKDISATIIDLAIRKYLRIIEETKKKIFKDKKTYSFELLKTDFSGLKDHEQKILNDIFPTLAMGEIVGLDSLKNKFYKTIRSLGSSLPKQLTQDGYFPSNPKYAGAFMYGAAFGLFILAVTMAALLKWTSVGLVISALILLIFAILMPKRTAQGVQAKEAIEGLKMYMQTAEADRIKMLQSPDAPYAKKSTSPKKTVELFEKLLPFAIVLGVENQWAKQFESIYKTPPDWYSGNWTTFNAVYFTSSLNNSVSAMGTSFSPPQSSGGSGFSGGGSGGGGGGGGGGGW